MNKYACLNPEPAPAWSIFDFAAAVLVAPVFETTTLLNGFSRARRTFVNAPQRQGRHSQVMPTRPSRSFFGRSLRPQTTL